MGAQALGAEQIQVFLTVHTGSIQVEHKNSQTFVHPPYACCEQ